MAPEARLTFAEHISELRRRLMWSLLFVALGAGVGFVLHDTLLALLQQPLNEQLYYTAPTGAFSFVIKICTVFGLMSALPAITYHGFAYFEPLIQARTKRTILTYVFISVALAGMGVAFAYFISLPAALHFLINFGSGDIEAIITANEYFNFVLAYLSGFALLFELPLVLAFINRIKPLGPRALLGGTRYVVLGSFVAAAIITPTPDPLNQVLMAGPVILLYLVSAFVVVAMNRIRRNKTPKTLEQVRSPAFESKPIHVPQPTPQPRPSFQQPVAKPATTRPFSDMVIKDRGTSIASPKRRPVVTPSQNVQRRPANRLISDFIPAAD